MHKQKNIPLISNIRSTNLRFNLDKEIQKQAWQYLQTMDKSTFRSYSNAIALAVVDYFSRYYRKKDDPYLETREREEEFTDRIVDAVKEILVQTLPPFLAGMFSGMAHLPQTIPVVPAYPMEDTGGSEAKPSGQPGTDVDWDFLGE